MKKLNIFKRLYIKTKIYLNKLFNKKYYGVGWTANVIERNCKKASVTEICEFQKFCNECSIDPVKFSECDHIDIIGDINNKSNRKYQYIGQAKRI